MKFNLAIDMLDTTQGVTISLEAKELTGISTIKELAR
jgi:hypothetical protein